MVSDHQPSPWEKSTYYHGVSVEPPELLYRSDYLDTPFPHPQGRIQNLSTKTAHGVFNTPLNAVWHTVAPKIRDILKASKIRYSAIQAARFTTHGQDEERTLGPVVIWIATHPGSTSTDDAHLASPGIVALLETNGVHGAVVEWIEGVVERLTGPPLMRVTEDTNPTHYARRVFTPALGMPIATNEMGRDYGEGSVAFFFHETKDHLDKPSSRVLAVSNCHVLREDPSIPYAFKGLGAPPQHVRLAGFRRFQRGLNEIKSTISGLVTNADTLAREIVVLETKLKLLALETKWMNRDLQEEEDEKKASLDARQSQLAKMKNNIVLLEAFYREVDSQWSDIASRTIGRVDWAPKIEVDVPGHRYTKDLGTFEVDADKFKTHFNGNVVDLGTKYTPDQLAAKFYPQSNLRTPFKFPPNRQLRIKGCVSREDLANPDTFDSNGKPCIVVMKDGNTTDLTVGRYAGLEAYICRDLGVECIELAIYNYDVQSGPFSSWGDSGSLIFDGEGKMLGILHSGLAKTPTCHVTYATPAWWAIEQLKAQYPYAQFDGEFF